ncbi:MAG: 1-acyl-sn-glycerol-3-phosphate acyltransferase [Acidimicrobiia bacterium]|nr:1-acyl-sn-glycerol-3-phosphate acyltransferase [Acidimicrobiia bacterium]
MTRHHESESGRAGPRPEPYWPKRPGFSIAYWFLRYGLEFLMRLLYRVKVEGRANVPRKGSVILAANHLSAFDPPFFAIAFRRRITALANARYFDSKNGWFFRGMGQIPLVPGDDISRDLAFDCARGLLGHGKILGIFPEGNRSLDGKLHRGRLGVAVLAREAGVPVVPAGIVGTFDVLPKGAKRPKVFRRITIRVGEPLTHPSGRAVDDRAFTDAVMASLAELTGQEQSNTYTESRTRRAEPAAS